MTTLGELASLIRSKNAGPFWLTFDILFDDMPTYERVVCSGVITPQRVAELYGFAKDEVSLIALRSALAIKISVPRPAVQGDLGEADMYAGQQYAPLVDIPISEGEPS